MAVLAPPVTLLPRANAPNAVLAPLLLAPAVVARKGRISDSSILNTSGWLSSYSRCLWCCLKVPPCRYLRPPARRHQFAGVWNSRDRRKVILFSGGAHGNTKTTDRLFRSKQRAVRNPAPLRDSHSATDRASGTRERPTSG